MFAEYYELLKSYISFKTVFGSKDFWLEAKKTVEWLWKLFQKNQIPFSLDLLESDSPVILALLQHDPSLPTVLVYSHYDLSAEWMDQKWKEDPFHLFLGKEDLIAKGVAEEKWCFMFFLKEIFSAREENRLAYNVKFLVSGDYHLPRSKVAKKWFSENKKQLEADFVFSFWSPNPSSDVFMTIGQKWAMELDIVFTPESSANQNRVYHVIQALGRMYDVNGKVTLPHFYFDVQQIPFSIQEQNFKLYKKKSGEKAFRLSWSALDPITQNQYFPSLTISEITKQNSSITVRLNFSLSGTQRYQKIVQVLDQWFAHMLEKKGINYVINVLDAYDAIHFSQNNEYYLKLRSFLVDIVNSEKIPLKYDVVGTPIYADLYLKDKEYLSFSVLDYTNNLGLPNENLQQTQILFLEKLIHSFFFK